MTGHVTAVRDLGGGKHLVEIEVLEEAKYKDVDLGAGNKFKKREESAISLLKGVSVDVSALFNAAAACVAMKADKDAKEKAELEAKQAAAAAKKRAG